MTRDEYYYLLGKAYRLSFRREEQMYDNGWQLIILKQVMNDENIEENIRKLSHYDEVKIYAFSTNVRGIYNYHAMVRNRG